jgi:hypothetical protein
VLILTSPTQISFVLCSQQSTSAHLTSPGVSSTFYSAFSPIVHVSHHHYLLSPIYPLLSVVSTCRHDDTTRLLSYRALVCFRLLVRCLSSWHHLHLLFRHPFLLSCLCLVLGLVLVRYHALVAHSATMLGLLLLYYWGCSPRCLLRVISLLVVVYRSIYCYIYDYNHRQLQRDKSLAQCQCRVP